MNRDIGWIAGPLAALALFAFIVWQTLGALSASGAWARGGKAPLIAPNAPFAFLDALGLAHEDGVLKDEATEPIGIEELKKACAALTSEPASAVRIYLNTLWLQDAERWANAKDVPLT